ncbi:hypothetical protein KY336_00830 [Candidatus Woesearchaeota archaeon]|nr:hypothetical protein [Candidatus Woesearchaeota archaeon]
MNKIKKRAVVGMSLSIIVVLILVVFALLIFFTLGEKSAEAGEKIIADTKCLASVELASRSEKVWLGDLIDCPTTYLSIGKEEDANYIISEALASCWHRFGQGKKKLFEHHPDTFGSQDKAAYCNVCYVFEFKKDVPSLTGLGTYLAKEKVSKKFIQAADVTYFEFLQGAHIDEDVKSVYANNILAGTTIDTSKPYAAVFVYTKDPSFFAKSHLLQKAQRAETIIGKVWYGALGLMFGKDIGAEWWSHVTLIPYQKGDLKNLCEILEE